MNILRTPFCLFLLFLAAVAAPSCRRKAPTSGDEALPVRVATPQRRTVLLTRQYPGYLKADKTVQLVARVSGTLLRCYYRPGAKVKADQPLFLIDPSTYLRSVEEAQATLHNAQANRTYMQATYERTAQAAKSDAVAQIQVIQTQAAFEQATAQVAEAEAALRLAQISLGYCYVNAPYAGHVSVNLYDEGNYLYASEMPTLATLYKDDTLYAYFNVSENDYLKRQKSDGHPALDSLLNHLTLHFPAFQTTQDTPTDLPTESARLEYVSPNVTLSTGTLTLRALIRNDDRTLRDGMYVLVTLPYARMEHALIVPDAAIGHDQIGTFLYIVEPSDSVRLQHIQTGQLIDDSLRIITSGLSASDRYIVAAQLKVRAGMKVTPIP